MLNEIKYQAFVVFLCAYLVLTSYTDSDKKQIVITRSRVSFGVRVSNDRLAMRKYSTHRFRWFQRVERFVKFVGGTKKTVITGMEFTNEQGSGGAKITILEGGLHQRHVLLHIVSQWNRGFNICVRVFALKNRKHRLTATQKKMIGRSR